MKNAITTLRIQNFKSIKDVTMAPRRVNIIIGEPNVGKSNILEAMSLLGGTAYEQTKKFMGSFIRYEESRQMFYDNQIANTIRILTEKERVVLGVKPSDNKLTFLVISADTQDEFFAKAKLPQIITPEIVERSLITNFFEKSRELGFDFSEQASFAYSEVSETGMYKVPDSPNSVTLSLTSQTSWPVKPYLFKKTFINKDYGHTFLRPPYGDNLISVIQSFPKLRQKIADFFKPYGLKIQLRVSERSLEVIKDLDGFIYSYPYSSIADTLQRLIFYLAAIESNDDAVLLFEEPEAHSYPVYVSQLARRIVASRNNQFFVVTHSPYLITEVLEEMMTNDELAPELAMFVAYYEGYQTKVRQLSDEEVRNIRRDGLDVFYNMARFVPQR